MNRNIIERSKSYEVLGNYLWIPKGTVKNFFSRYNRDISNPKDVGKYIDSRLYNRWWVYIIENTMNGKKYIGKATSMFYRWQWHKKSLLKGVHTNKWLQKDYNLYWVWAFVYMCYGFIDTDEERSKIEEGLIASYPRAVLYNRERVFNVFNNKEVMDKIANNHDKFMEFLKWLDK